MRLTITILCVAAVLAFVFRRINKWSNTSQIYKDIAEHRQWSYEEKNTLKDVVRGKDGD
jgi:hypothetical protein